MVEGLGEIYTWVHPVLKYTNIFYIYQNEVEVIKNYFSLYLFMNRLKKLGENLVLAKWELTIYEIVAFHCYISQILLKFLWAITQVN